ncbi:hypothetical protein K8Q96_02880 [Candidatus Nomurabacteria bacterium]|nr:hypothetical protein [Candidatus Nomurabacteria bacterium]
MPKKTKIIFITTFVIVGAIMLYFYFSRNTNTNTQTTDAPFYQRFNPFNSNNNSNGSQSGGVNSDGVALDDTGAVFTNSVFQQLTDFSVAGATFFQYDRLIPPSPETPANTPPQYQTVSALRYVERITGHIYQRDLDTKNVAKISNSTIPSIYESILDSKASTTIYRYLSTDNRTITSFMATLGATKGEFLSSDIIDISTSLDKTKFFYLTKNTSGVVGTIRSFTETKKSQVFTSHFTEWLSQWVGDQKIYLTTKASYSASGYLFSLNTTNGTLTKVKGPTAGLTTLANNNGSIVLYSVSTSNGPQLFVFDTVSHISNSINLYGLPEKCIWSSDNIYVYCALPSNINNPENPDAWYQGIVSFNDSFVKINTITFEVENIANSNDNTAVDATHLILDNTETNIFFINKKDSTLWSLNLSN